MTETRNDTPCLDLAQVPTLTLCTPSPPPPPWLRRPPPAESGDLRPQVPRPGELCATPGTPCCWRALWGKGLVAGPLRRHSAGPGACCASSNSKVQTCLPSPPGVPPQALSQGAQWRQAPPVLPRPAPPLRFRAGARHAPYSYLPLPAPSHVPEVNPAAMPVHLPRLGAGRREPPAALRLAFSESAAPPAPLTR
jgi:hypothetical protein